MFKKKLLSISIFLFFFPLVCSSATQENKLNILIWGGLIDPKVIEKFEQDTGIHVSVHLLDSDEAIEAKLLTGESGFDLISPTLSPFYIRQMKLGLFNEITEKDVPNLKNVDPFIDKFFKNMNLDIQYGVPFSWGVIGFAYHTEKVKQLLGDQNIPTDSWDLLYNPTYAKALQSCGIQLLDDPLEVFFSLFFYTHKQHDFKQADGLEQLTTPLKKIMPYVKKFDSSADSTINTLVGEKACVVQCFSGEANKAIQILKEKNTKSPIKFVRPKEGFSIFLDVLAVPKNASNPENAYRFINFLLEPENAAQNFIYSLQPSTIKNYKEFLPAAYQELAESFPKELGEKSFKMDGDLSFRQTKKISHAWLRARLNI